MRTHGGESKLSRDGWCIIRVDDLSLSLFFSFPFPTNITRSRFVSDRTDGPLFFPPRGRRRWKKKGTRRRSLSTENLAERAASASYPLHRSRRQWRRFRLNVGKTLARGEFARSLRSRKGRGERTINAAETMLYEAINTFAASPPYARCNAIKEINIAIGNAAG